MPPLSRKGALVYTLRFVTLFSAQYALEDCITITERE